MAMKKTFLIFIIFFNFISCFASSFNPVVLETPQSTFKTYLRAMSDYVEGIKTNNPLKIARLQDAIKCFNLSQTHFILKNYEGKKAALLLKEILDRYIKINFDLIPDTHSLNFWRLKGTEIIIEKVVEQDKTFYQFSKNTIKKLPLYYAKIKNKPYLDSLEGSYYNQSSLEKFKLQFHSAPFLGLNSWQWFLIAFLIFVSFLIKFLIRTIDTLLINITGKKYFKHFENPVFLLTVSGVWFFFLEISELNEYGFKVLRILFQVLLGSGCLWFIYSLTYPLEKFIHNIISPKITRFDVYFLPLVSKMLRIIVLLFGILLIIQSLGFNVVSLLAGLGLGGLAFALAAKDTAANFFGSLMIFLDQPFKRGDVITTDGITGTVMHVGFRSTQIKTFYDSLISIPNSNLANKNIDNLQERKLRRVETLLEICYDKTNKEKLEQLIRGIRTIFQNEERIEQNSFYACFHNYGKTNLEILIYFFIKTNEWSDELKVRHHVFLEIYSLAEKLQIQFRKKIIEHE